MIKVVRVVEHDSARSSTKTANKNGVKTEPCRTPKLMRNITDHSLNHLTHEKQQDNQFSNKLRNFSGIYLLINLRYKAWWFTLISLWHIRLCYEYTVSHEKRATLISTLTLAFLERLLCFLYQWKGESKCHDRLFHAITESHYTW